MCPNLPAGLWSHPLKSVAVCEESSQGRTKGKRAELRSAMAPPEMLKITVNRKIPTPTS